MSVENILMIVSLSITAISVGVSIITLFKKHGSKMLVILKKIPEYIKEAEATFGAKTGAMKLSWVVTKVQMDCLKAKVDMSNEEITEKVEEYLSTPHSKEGNQ